MELLQEKLQICSFRLLPSWSAGLVQVAIFSTQEIKNVQIVERVHSFIRLLKCKRFHVHVSAPAREVLLLSLSLSTVAGTGLPDIMDESNFDECSQERAGRLGDGRVHAQCNMYSLPERGVCGCARARSHVRTLDAANARRCTRRRNRAQVTECTLPKRAMDCLPEIFGPNLVLVLGNRVSSPYIPRREKKREFCACCIVSVAESYSSSVL